MKLRGYKKIPVVVGLLYLAVFVAWFALKPSFEPEVLLSVFGAVTALGYFLYNRHLEESRFFRELFIDFNERYDKLNDHLNRIVGQAAQPLSADDQAHIVDYFNLCAEEFFWREAGYIDDAVWEAWFNGMREFARDSRIQLLWQRERSSNSYYGFELPAA